MTQQSTIDTNAHPTESPHSDQLYRYIFEELNCRGEYVTLNQSLNQVLANHDYPQPVKKLLAEMMAITALLTATLKFKGDIALQIQGDGPVSYAVINSDDQLAMRGMARISSAIEHEDPVSLASLVGKAQLVITINPQQGERYQGIVAVEGSNMAECIENYFQQSEQLQTRIWLASDLNTTDHRACAVFLQIIPTNKQQAMQDFEHLATLTETVTETEMLSLSPTQLLLRLYHQDNPKVFNPQPIQFQCSCSIEKIQAALKNIGYQSLIQQIDQQGPIQVDCQFCLKPYRFDRAAIEKLFQ